MKRSIAPCLVPAVVLVVALCSAGVADASIIQHTVRNPGFDNNTEWVGAHNGMGTNPNGWTSQYYTGGHVTDGKFLTGIHTGLTQTLSGADSTFVTGRTYTLTIDIFAPDLWASALNDATFWKGALTAGGVVVAEKAYFTPWHDGLVDADLVLPYGAGSPGPFKFELTYTATAEDHGKVIGIMLGGDSSAYPTTSAPNSDGRPKATPRSMTTSS